MDKPELILLHGWGGSKQSLKPLSDELQNLGYKTHVLEMPGHGTTSEMSSPWNMQDFANWLKQYIDGNVNGEYVLVGHSFGGKIILEILTTHLLKPKEVVLINANGIKPRNSIKKKFFFAISKVLGPLFKLPILKELRYLIYKFIIGETDYAKTASNLRESFKLFNDEHYDDKLSNIGVKAVLIWSDNDKQTPLWMGEKLKQSIKNSELIILPGTHGLPLKEPKLVSKIISEKI